MGVAAVVAAGSVGGGGGRKKGGLRERERERERTVLCAYTIRMKLTLCSMRGESERIAEIYVFLFYLFGNVPVFWKRWWLLSFFIFIVKWF